MRYCASVLAGNPALCVPHRAVHALHPIHDALRGQHIAFRISMLLPAQQEPSHRITSQGRSVNSQDTLCAGPQQRSLSCETPVGEELFASMLRLQEHVDLHAQRGQEAENSSAVPVPTGDTELAPRCAFGGSDPLLPGPAVAQPSALSTNAQHWRGSF